MRYFYFFLVYFTFNFYGVFISVTFIVSSEFRAEFYCFSTSSRRPCHTAQQGYFRLLSDKVVDEGIEFIGVFILGGVTFYLAKNCTVVLSDLDVMNLTLQLVNISQLQEYSSVDL